MRWRRFLYLGLSVSAAGFAVGLVVEGFWGASVHSGRTNWVDQSFGLVMYLGFLLIIVLAALLLASLLVAGGRRLLSGEVRRRVI